MHVTFKVEIADRKGQSIPEGWAVDKDGKTTSDPKQAEGLFPLGGAEHTCKLIHTYNKPFSQTFSPLLKA